MKKYVPWIVAGSLVVTLASTSAMILAVKNVLESSAGKDDTQYDSLPLRKICEQAMGIERTADGKIDAKNAGKWQDNQNIMNRASDLNEEGNKKAQENNYKGALVDYEASLEQFKRYPGLGCAQAVALLTDKAKAEAELGLVEEREQTLRLLVEASEKAYNQNHEQFAGALEALGGMLSDQDREAEALPFLDRAYAIRLKGAGIDSGDTAYTASLLGHCHLDLKHYQLADDFYKKAIAVYTKLDGEGFSESQQIARENLVNSYRWQKRYKEAVELDLTLLEQLKAKHLADSDYAGAVYCSLADTAQGQRDKVKMTAYLGEAKKIAEVLQKDPSESTRKAAVLYNDIADVYNDEDDLAGELEARKKCVECGRALKYRQQEDDERTAINLVKAGYCSFKLKDMDHARTYFGEVLSQAKNNDDIRVKLRDSRKQIEEYLQYIEKNKSARDDAATQLQAHELKELILS